MRLPVCEFKLCACDQQVAQPKTCAHLHKEGPCVQHVRALALIALVLSLASITYGATISGTVKGPDGKPFKGAFVEAQDMDSRIATNVLSDKDGRYRIENLPEGQYQLLVRAVGYRFEPRTGIQLAAGQNATYEIALEKGTVHWTDLSIYQGEQLLPAGTRQGQADHRLLPLPRISEPHGRPSTRRNRLARSRQLHAHQLWLPAERCQREGRRRRHRVSHEIFRAGFAAAAFSRGTAGV